MPLYVYRCPVCEKTEEYALPMEHRAPECECVATFIEGARTYVVMERVYTPALIPPSRVQE